MSESRSKFNDRVTIDDVAQLAGVSKTTVSRYLNGRYEVLSETTKQRIADVIEQLHYRPNRIAQGLKAQNRHMIGCLVSDIGSPFSSIVVKGINSVCQQNGYQLLLVDSADDPVREREGIQQLLENQVDGLIINTTGENDDYLLALQRQEVRLVLADRCLSAPGVIDTVATDNYHITYQTICQLQKFGYQQVAFFTQGNKRVSPRILRFQGYCDAVKGCYGKSYQPLLYSFSLEEEFSCIQQISEFHSRFAGQRLAVFAVNGVTMLHLLQGIRSLQIEIGPDFGVCGYDDWGWADLIQPGITTISQDSWSVGHRAAEILLDRINNTGESVPIYEELKNTLEIRGSTVYGK